MHPTRPGPTRRLRQLGLAVALAPACAHPAPAPAGYATPSRQAASVTLTIFTGFAGAPSWPTDLPRFAPLAPVFAACPDVRVATTVALPMTAAATATVALPDGGQAHVGWEDPAKLRLRVGGVPRAEPGAVLTYQLITTGGAILFWGPTAGGVADRPCAYVVVGDGAPAATRSTAR